MYKKSHETSVEILCIAPSCLFQKGVFNVRTCAALAAEVCAGMQKPSDKNGLQRVAFFSSAERSL